MAIMPYLRTIFRFYLNFSTFLKKISNAKQQQNFFRLPVIAKKCIDNEIGLRIILFTIWMIFFCLYMGCFLQSRRLLEVDIY